MTQAWFKAVSYYALAHTETSEATYDLVRALVARGVPGDLVECGVFAGAQPAIMAQALIDSGSEGRRVHLFDSFEGIPAGGPQDHELKGKPAGISKCSMYEVQANMRKWGIPDKMLVYHPGWFEDTVPKNEIEEISLLRLDGDLYDSTKVCLDYLYPKVVRGGWVCIDDFNLSGCRQATLEKIVPAPIYWRVPTK